MCLSYGAIALADVGAVPDLAFRRTDYLLPLWGEAQRSEPRVYIQRAVPQPSTRPSEALDWNRSDSLRCAALLFRTEPPRRAIRQDRKCAGHSIQRRAASYLYCRHRLGDTVFGIGVPLESEEGLVKVRPRSIR